MPKTLAELRTAKNVGPATTIYPLCLMGGLTEKLQELDARLADVPARDPDDKRPRTMADRDPRAELEAEREAIRQEMEDHLCPVLLRAKPGSQWETWVAEHPPREGNSVDELIDCNTSDLQAALPEHIVTVAGEPLGAGDWEFLAQNASLGDLREMAYLVAQMQFGRIAVPKSRTVSPDGPASANA